MITQEGQVKIIDLGFAIDLKGRDGSGWLDTRLGTMHYMAPEIVYGIDYHGADVDVYALGMTLFVSKCLHYPW